MKLYHGGVPGKVPGDILRPSPPHQEDGCPICVARAEDRGCTVAEYRAWLIEQGPRAEAVLEMLEGAPLWEIIDPPTGRHAIYATSDLAYARWYAARSRGDLYEVNLCGGGERSTEDPFPSWFAEAAEVVTVVERRVRLVRRDRRQLMRRWKKTERRTPATGAIVF